MTEGRKMDEENGNPYRLMNEGWRYFDPDTVFTPDMWEFYLDHFGRDEVIVLDTNRRVDGMMSGQILVSPKGIENGRKRLEEENE